MHLELTTDRTVIRAAHRSTRYVQCHLTAPTLAQAQPRRPLDLALVLDRSGSMAGHKLERAAAAAQATLNHLDQQDRVALVVYDDQVDTLVELLPVEDRTRQRVTDALAMLDSGGSTNLSGGWLTGCGLVGQPSEDQRLHRCFLLTDGMANEGIIAPDELSHHGRQLRQLGVVTSTFGLGDDYDESLLGSLADACGGSFYDIARAESLQSVLHKELGDALAIVGNDIRLRIQWKGDFRVQGLGAWTSEYTPGQLTLHIGDLVSAQMLDVMLAVQFPTGAIGSTQQLSVEVWEGDTLKVPAQTLTWTADRNSVNNIQPRERSVDRLVARYYAHHARAQATNLNRQGKLEQARILLAAVAERIQSYAGDDPEMNQLLVDLCQEAEKHRHRRSSRDLKEEYHRSYSQRRGRDAFGERLRDSV